MRHGHTVPEATGRRCDAPSTAIQGNVQVTGAGQIGEELVLAARQTRLEEQIRILQGRVRRAERLTLALCVIGAGLGLGVPSPATQGPVQHETGSTLQTPVRIRNAAGAVVLSVNATPEETELVLHAVDGTDRVRFHTRSNGTSFRIGDPRKEDQHFVLLSAGADGAELRFHNGRFSYQQMDLGVDRSGEWITMSEADKSGPFQIVHQSWKGKREIRMEIGNRMQHEEYIQVVAGRGVTPRFEFLDKKRVIRHTLPRWSPQRR